MVRDCRHDRLDDVAMGADATSNMDMRFGIEGLALLGEAGQRLRAISLLEQGSIVAPAGALGEHVDWRIQPDGNGALVKQLPGARIVEGPAASGDDPDVAFHQSRHETALAIAEIMLTISIEQFGRGRTRCLLDFDIAIDEGQAQTPRKAAAYGRLSCAHQPHQYDRPIQYVGQLMHGPGLYIVA